MPEINFLQGTITLLPSRLYCRYPNCTDSAKKARGLSPPVRNFTFPEEIKLIKLIILYSQNATKSRNINFYD